MLTKVWQRPARFSGAGRSFSSEQVRDSGVCRAEVGAVSRRRPSP